MRSLRLEGKFAVLEEISPKYFQQVIDWRNDKNLNKFLNQPFELTLELEKKWYENYLRDETQGLMIILDKATNTPIGTTGWTDFDAENRRCICGRLLLGRKDFAGSPAFIERVFLLGDFLYQFVDVEFIHVVKKNRRALHINKILGFVPNTGEIQYPRELFVNGMEQIELYRTKEMFLEIRRKFDRLGDALFT